MNDREAAIKQYRESLVHEYKLVMRLQAAREILEEERKKLFSQSRSTETFKSVLLNEFGLSYSELESFDSQAVKAALVA